MKKCTKLHAEVVQNIAKPGFSVTLEPSLALLSTTPALKVALTLEDLQP